MDLSPEEILCRKNTLKHFDKYFENVTNTLKNFTEKIGWNIDETPTDDVLIQCPVNSAHKILPSNLDSHRQSCELEQSGYNSTHSLYPSHNSSTPLDQTIHIDKTTQMNILKSAHEESNFTLNIKHEARDVSQSIERYVCDFTPDERRVLYDHAVQNTKLSNQVAISDLIGVDVVNKSNEKPKTDLEMLQEQRDLKRRTVAYRGKRVHTDRKSHIEVLREVVEGLTNSLHSQQDTSICTEASSSGAQTVLNNRIVYKYEGIQNYGSNPYTRWLDIESEESKLINSSEMKNYRSSYKSPHYKESTSSSSGLQISKRPNSRSPSNSSSNSSSKSRSRSRSRSRTRSKEHKYKSIGFRSPTKFEKNKYKSSKTGSMSRETMPRESNFRRSKRHRSRTRSKSQELNSYKKVKTPKSPINYFKLSIPNEEETTVKLKSSHTHKKRKKDKKSKRKHI